jgi:DNA-binding NarL/FixJ family response regulator
MTGRPRVLIADDYAPFGAAIERLLAPDCDVIGSVPDGAAALDAAKRLHPDVIVLDVNMKNLNGLEACRRITLDLPDVKVIVVTAMDDATITQAAFAAGAAAFVAKHVVGQDLPAAISQVCADRSSPH